MESMVTPNIVGRKQSVSGFPELMFQIHFHSMAYDYANKSKGTSLSFDLVLRLVGRNTKGLSTADVRVGVGNKTNSI